MLRGESCMDRTADNLDEARFRRMARVKQSSEPPVAALGPEMVAFFKQSVEKRQTKFARIANAWSQLVPETLAAHCALESFSRGSLTVLVDSASHLYELKQLLLAGLQQQLLLAVPMPACARSPSARAGGTRTATGPGGARSLRIEAASASKREHHSAVVLNRVEAGVADDAVDACVGQVPVAAAAQQVDVVAQAEADAEAGARGEVEVGAVLRDLLVGVVDTPAPPSA